MSSRHPRSWHRPALLVLTLLGLLPCPGLAASPAEERCDKESAKPSFLSGMENYARRNYKGAIPPLEEAVNFCPAPSAPWSVTVALLGQYPYTPLYYLGKCHYNLKDLPNALRDFSLSSCFGETKRHKETTEDLASLKEMCRRQIAGKERAQGHPYFRAGLSAAQDRKWEKAAEKMWDALHVWKEDGGPTNSYGRWIDPYLPRFRLAEALFELGCYREAADQLDQSLVGTLRAPEMTEERQRMAKLKPECEQRIHQGYQDKEICQRWRCWLQ